MHCPHACATKAYKVWLCCTSCRGYYRYSIDELQPGARPADAYNPIVTVAAGCTDGSLGSAVIPIAETSTFALGSTTAPPAIGTERPAEGSGANARIATVSLAELALHQSSESCWTVVDDEWVLDVTNFVSSHPGGEKIFTATIGSKFSFSDGPNAHFQSTQHAFRVACASFIQQQAEAVGSVGAPIHADVHFWRSRVNGGLDRDGKELGEQPSIPQGTVTIVGRLAK